jgi:hypothetical protein
MSARRHILSKSLAGSLDTFKRALEESQTKEDLNTFVIKTKWLNIISPCTIAIVFCVIAIISSLASKIKGDLNSLTLPIFLPSIIILLVVDIIVKYFAKRRVLYVWIIELALLALLIFAFRQIDFSMA